MYRYLTKPTPVDELVIVLRDAAREKSHAMARQDMPPRRHGYLAQPPAGQPEPASGGDRRPAVVLLLAASAAPPPTGLVDLLARPRAATAAADPVAGYANYRQLAVGESIADHYSARSPSARAWRAANRRDRARRGGAPS